MKKFSRGIAIGLVITLCLWGWGLAGYAQDSPLPKKSISPDEVNPKLETVLQELSRTAQIRPLAIPELAQARGIVVRDDMITVIVEPVSGNASRIDRVAVRALGGTIEATSKSLMRVRVPISLRSVYDWNPRLYFSYWSDARVAHGSCSAVTQWIMKYLAFQIRNDNKRLST